jgi:hypothetical protein
MGINDLENHACVAVAELQRKGWAGQAKAEYIIF